MSKVLIEEQTLHDIGDAIRDLINTNKTYKPAEMAYAISNIDSNVNTFIRLSSDSMKSYPEGSLVVTLDSESPQWTANPEYVVYNADTYLSSHFTTFYKTNNGLAIGVEFSGNGSYGPFLISTIPEHVMFTDNNGITSISNRTATIDGVTWYLSTTSGWNGAEDANHKLPALYNPPIDYNSIPQIIQAILDASNVQYTEDPTTVVIGLNDVCIIINETPISIINRGIDWTPYS